MILLVQHKRPMAMRSWIQQ